MEDDGKKGLNWKAYSNKPHMHARFALIHPWAAIFLRQNYINEFFYIKIFLFVQLRNKMNLRGSAATRSSMYPSPHSPILPIHPAPILFILFYFLNLRPELATHLVDHKYVTKKKFCWYQDLNQGPPAVSLEPSVLTSALCTEVRNSRGYYLLLLCYTYVCIICCTHSHSSWGL